MLMRSGFPGGIKKFWTYFFRLLLKIESLWMLCNVLWLHAPTGKVGTQA